MMVNIEFELNGKQLRLEVDTKTSLLDVLRNDFELNGPKFGCGLGQCGACAVLLNGVSVRSCITPVAKVEGQKITTLEGLGSKEKPHPLQNAFIDQQATQCGYCSNGIIITAAALLNTTISPSDDDIKSALSGHLCRCGAHPRIVKAVAQAAADIKGKVS